MMVSMVMAMDRNQLIGKDGGMPWHLPSEMQYFKKVTMGKPLIMGRKTYESIGRPLPGRTSIVVTRNADWPAEVGSDNNHQDYLASGQLRVVSTVDEAFRVAQGIVNASENDIETTGENEIAVIGGAAICELAMPYCQRLYLTVIDAEFEGDTWLQSFNRDEWNLVSESPVSMDGYELSYQVLEREADKSLPSL